MLIVNGITHFLMSLMIAMLFIGRYNQLYNEGWLFFQKKKIDRQTFSINILEINGKKVLIRPEIADKGKGNNIVFGDPLTMNPSRRVDTRKAPDKKETIRNH